MTNISRMVVISLVLVWIVVAAVLVSTCRSGSSGQSAAEAAYTTNVGMALYVLADTLDTYDAIANASDAGSPTWQASVRTFATNLADACSAVRDQHTDAPRSYQDAERLLDQAMARCIDADTAVAAAAEKNDPAELERATDLLIDMNELIRQSAALLPMK